MSEQQVPTGTSGGERYPRGAEAPEAMPAAGGQMTGWITFAGVVMAVVGVFAIFEGFVALFAPTAFVTTSAGVLVLNLNGWGWLHIILGALVLLTGLALIGTAPPWARAVGTILVAINMIVQLAFLPSYPIWSIVVLALDMFVLYALIVSWAPADER